MACGESAGLLGLGLLLVACWVYLGLEVWDEALEVEVSLGLLLFKGLRLKERVILEELLGWGDLIGCYNWLIGLLIG